MIYINPPLPNPRYIPTRSWHVNLPTDGKMNHSRMIPGRVYGDFLFPCWLVGEPAPTDAGAGLWGFFVSLLVGW